MDVKFPNVTVQLTGSDGNAFMIIGKVRQAMRLAGVSSEEITKFSDDAMSGDYDNVLQTCMRTVNVE